jgi:hypothetical protein
VTIQGCCEKCRTSSQMPNMQMCCTFMASLMEVPLLVSTNTVDSFLCTEFWITECFPRCSINCMNVVHFPVLKFHMKKHINKIVAILLACKDFPHVSVFHEHGYGEHCVKTACTHFTHGIYKIYTRRTMPCV